MMLGERKTFIENFKIYHHVKFDQNLIGKLLKVIILIFKI